jgi:uncharacterized protein YjbJ (UPF0337 family)
LSSPPRSAFRRHGYRAGTSDFLSKAKDALGNVTDNALLEQAEDVAEDKADDGGTIGSIADKADDAIDQIQGTKD